MSRYATSFCVGYPCGTRLTHSHLYNQDYNLGDPRKEDVTLGPVVSLRSAAAIRSHIADAGKASSADSLVHRACLNLFGLL